jgi:hypothetical protein
MKRIAKLAGFTLLGFVIAAVVYWLLAFGVLEAIRSRSGRSPESYLDVAFLVMMPVALFLGSSFTGYLGRPHLRTRFGLIGVTPGLYLSLVFIIMNFAMAESDFAISMLLPGLLWFLISWAGVGLGCFVRSRKNGNRTNGCT